MSTANSFSSRSVTSHLARGAIGFGLIGAGLGLTDLVGPAALLLAPAGLVALRGCPMCWTMGLIETISAGKLERACSAGSCKLQPTSAVRAPALTARGDRAAPRSSRPPSSRRSTGTP